MIERDYIMRMIQQLTSVLAKALFNKEIQQFDDTLKEIGTTGERLIGMKWQVIRAFTDRQIIDLLGYEENLYKMFAAAELLRTESDVLLDQGKEDESYEQGMKAFSLFVELTTRELSYFKLLSVDKFAVLMSRLEGYEFLPVLEFKRFQYYVTMKEYEKAEEVISFLSEKHPEFRDKSVPFYRMLLAKSNEELSDANLDRGELELEAGKLEKFLIGNRS